VVAVGLLTTPLGSLFGFVQPRKKGTGCGKAAYQAPGRRHRVLPQVEQSQVQILAAGSLEERLSLLHAAASEVLPFVAECGETLVPLHSAVQGRARFQKFDANAGNPDVSIGCHVAAYISCHGILRNQDVS